MIFKIDDITLNTNIDRLENMIKEIENVFPSAEIYLAVSLVVFDMSKEEGILKERMNPGTLNILSDHTCFYEGNKLGMPDLSRFVNSPKIHFISHGFIHVDHRLLAKELQEWNIIQSCNIICPDKKIFAPPRHKWNSDTESICRTNNIGLVKVENNWKHLKFNGIEFGTKYYFHTYDFESNKTFLTKLSGEKL